MTKVSDIPDNTGGKQESDTRFKPGQSGNPDGRPKGSRTKFGESMVKDFLADWELHGAQAIKDVREKSPDAYLKAACTVLPKVIELDDDTKGILKGALSSHLPFDQIRKKVDGE